MKRKLIIVELFAAAAATVAIVLVLLWVLNQDDSAEVEIESLMLADADMAALESAFELRLKHSEVVEVDLPSWVPDEVRRVPSLTLGWLEPATDRRLILIGYYADLPAFAAEIYEGHAATVRPGAIANFPVETTSSSLGLIAAPDGIEAPARSYRGAFHRGRLFVDVYLDSPDANDERDVATVRGVMDRSIAKAPDAAPGSAFPSGPVFAGQAVGFALAALGAYLALNAFTAWVRDPLRSELPAAHVQGGFETVIDVTDLADRARRTARVHTLLIGVGLAIATPGLLPLSWPLGLLGLILGGLLVAGSLRAQTRSIQPNKRRRSATGPLRAKAYGVLATTSVSVGLLLLTLAGAGVVVTSLAYADNLRFLVSGVVLVTIGSALNRYVWRLRAVAGEEAQQNDDRLPVLFLRAFADDSLRIRSARSGRVGIANRLNPRGFDRFEELIARSLGAQGPVVAVNPPGTYLAPLGAARESLASETWKDEVQKRISKAGLIAIGASRGLEAEGFKWELERIGAGQRWSSVLFVLPPVPVAELRIRWEAFSSLLNAAINEEEPSGAGLPIDPTGALVIVGSPGDGWTAVSARRRDEWTYAAALDRAALHLDAPCRGASSNDPSTNMN